MPDGGQLRTVAFYPSATAGATAGEELFAAYIESTMPFSARYGHGALHNDLFILGDVNSDTACSSTISVTPFRFWTSSAGGVTSTHTGWPNNIRPNTAYSLQTNWNDFTEASQTKNWLETQTTCGCSTSEPKGTPEHLVAVQTDSHMKFRFKDMSGCEKGFNFFRSMLCTFNSNLLPHGSVISTVTVDLHVVQPPSAMTPHTVSVYDPSGMLCDIMPLAAVVGQRKLQASLHVSKCIFDGCLPRVYVRANSGGQQYTVTHITVTEDRGTALIDDPWTHTVAHNVAGTSSVGVYPVLPSQDALDAEYLRTSGCFENHFTSRSGDVVAGNEAMFAVGNVIR